MKRPVVPIDDRDRVAGGKVDDMRWSILIVVVIVVVLAVWLSPSVA